MGLKVFYFTPFYHSELSNRHTRNFFKFQCNACLHHACLIETKYFWRTHRVFCLVRAPKGEEQFTRLSFPHNERVAWFHAGFCSSQRSLGSKYPKAQDKLLFISWSLPATIFFWQRTFFVSRLSLNVAPFGQQKMNHSAFWGLHRRVSVFFLTARFISVVRTPLAPGVRESRSFRPISDRRRSGRGWSGIGSPHVRYGITYARL